MDGRIVCRGATEDGSVREGASIRLGDGHVSAKGLGSQSAEVLGHADSDGVLRAWPRGRGGRWRGSAARERPSCGAAGAGRNHAAGRLAAGAGGGFREYNVPGVRRSSTARDGYDGHVRRFELVLLPLYGCEELVGAVCKRESKLLVSHRPVHRWRGARDSAFDLLTLLDEGDAGPGFDQE